MEIGGGTPLLARWTTDWDCGHETSFWAVIKDDEYDISKLKAKRRYEITKGRRNFEVRRIEAKDYLDELFETTKAAFCAYPEKYRPTIEHDAWIEDYQKQSGITIAAFHGGMMCGYAYLTLHPNFIEYNVQKTNPEFERMGVNAALVDGVLTEFRQAINNGGLIIDDWRAINHETAFQDYLEKYFGFRKAYCKLHVAYNPKIRCAIPIIWKFRKQLEKKDSIGLIHQINAVLRMEEIQRGQ